MKGIVCAFEGRLARDADIKTVKATGRPFLAMSVIEGDGDEAQWINVVAWSESLTEIAAHLVKGVAVYIEGKVRLRTWESADGSRASLSVSASLVQPLALIGRSKPKAPRAAAKGKSRAKTDLYAPSSTTFADGTDAAQGDAMPF